MATEIRPAASMVSESPQRFRVHSSVQTDPAVFEQEIRRIFYGAGGTASSPPAHP